MKKIYLFFVFIFLVNICISAQVQLPDYERTILIEDLDGGQKLLRFGVDTTATDGIDPHLGESDLPPFPPQGAFEARFFLPENNFQGTLGSYQDYRQGLLPLFDTLEYRLAYQVGTGTVIKVTWYFTPDISGLLQDLFGGVIVNQAMADTGSYTVANPTALNRLKVLIYYNGSVPVELTSFGAVVNGRNVILNWETASETNNYGFEIQRKSESNSFEKIGFIQSAGNSTSSNSYSFVDENVSGGLYTYRLKIIDFDGSFIYSKEVEVDFSINDYTLFQNFPNPFNPSTDIRFSVPMEGFVSIKVYDMLGQEVATLFSDNTKPGVKTITWNGKDNSGKEVSSGSYIFKMISGSFHESKKMILIK